MVAQMGTSDCNHFEPVPRRALHTGIALQCLSDKDAIRLQEAHRDRSSYSDVYEYRSGTAYTDGYACITDRPEAKVAHGLRFDSPLRVFDCSVR